MQQPSFDPIRRDFLRWAAASGLSAALPCTWASTKARAATAAPPPLLFCIEAIGAFDTTLLCDPRGNAGQASPPNVGYTPQQIKTYGAFQVAPQIPAVGDFFATYYQHMLVINGVDTSTIDHATGSRSSMSGTGGTGYPVTPALVAAVLGSQQPAAYMSNGGVNTTENIVGLTYLGSGIADALVNPMDGNGIHRPETWSAINSAITARLSSRQRSVQAALPAQRLQLMQQGYAGAANLSALTATMADLAANVPTASPTKASLNSIDAQTALAVQVAMSGYQHGQTSSVALVVGSFDTHSTNDASQTTQQTLLMSTMDYIVRCAQHLGQQNSLLIYVGSDFGRTPYYNTNQAGKDHWPTTSVLFVNPAAQPNMPTNQVWGGTDAGLSPLSVNPKTRALDSSGITIQPGHIHDAIRRWYQIDQSPLALHYGLGMSAQMPLLG